MHLIWLFALILVPGFMIHWWMFREMRYYKQEQHLKIQLSRMAIGFAVYLTAIPLGIWISLL